MTLLAELRGVFPWADVFRDPRDQRIAVQWACARGTIGACVLFRCEVPGDLDADDAVAWVARQMRQAVRECGPVVAQVAEA